MDLVAFQEWLILKRGCVKGTAKLYAQNVLNASQHHEGFFGKLTDPNIAPKTKRHIKAAIVAYARFTKDRELEASIREVRLPPADRVTVKIPLDRDLWVKFITVLDDSQAFSPEIRACMGIIAIRGYRVSDVLRMERKEILRGLQTGILSTVGKGRKRLEYTVQPFRKYLITLLGVKDWVKVADLISNSKRDDMTAARVKLLRAFKTLAKEVGIDPKDIFTHRFRRTVATMFLDHPSVKGDLEKLRQFMGWSNVTIAAGYADHDRRKELDVVADDLLDITK